MNDNRYCSCCMNGCDCQPCCFVGPRGPRGPIGPTGPGYLPVTGTLSGDNQIIELPSGNIERQVALPQAVFPAQFVEYATNSIRILQTGYYVVSYYVQGATNPAAVWYAYGKLNGVFTPLLDDRNYNPVAKNVTLRGESVMYLHAGDTLTLFVNADTATTLTIRDVGGAQLTVTRIPLAKG